MKPFVLDTSVTVAWCFSSQANEYSRKVLLTLQETSAIVPAIWNYEIANAMLNAERRGKQSRAESVKFLEALEQLPITVVPDAGRGWRNLLLWMGKTHGLSGYDTAYLYLAMDRGLDLATRDAKLLAAAKSAGVSIYPS